MSSRWCWVLAVGLWIGVAVTPVAAASAESVPAPTRALLARGINLNDWFTPWANPAGYATEFRPEEAAFLKQAGFTVCRLPLAPDLLFDEDHPDQLKSPVRWVDQAVRELLDAGLGVILDPIHSDSSQARWESRLYHEPAFRQKVALYWETLARHYAAISSDKIVFEVMNEPHLTRFEKVPSDWWSPVQEELAAAIRRGAPHNTILATGSHWGGSEGLLALRPLADRNVVYSFHWYLPFVFTHQGAAWTGTTQAGLHDIPYPSSPDAVAPVLAGLDNPPSQKAARAYGAERWNRATLLAQIQPVADWSRRYGVPVFCGEFGAYRKASHEDDRVRWLTDMHDVLSTLGIGWSMWDYETDFGLVTFDVPRLRQGPRVDAQYLKALGLDASATLTITSAGPTIADFAAHRAPSFELPASTWNSLWTREPGTGQVSVTLADGMAVGQSLRFDGQKDWSLASGIPVPVEAGERLKLSATARVDGEGSVRLAWEARGPDGQVITWSLGAVEVPSGAEVPVSTVVVVPQGVTSLEPRWSGSGPVTAQLGNFHGSWEQP